MIIPKIIFRKMLQNVDIIEYKKATGFEALIGYLYLTKNNDRLNFLIDLCIKNAD